MIKSNLNVGIDLFEIERLRSKPFEKNKSLYAKIFHTDEIDYCLRFSDPYPHFAGIFAAKEAIIKCYPEKIFFNNIVIDRKNNKIPLAKILDNKNSQISISISHTSKLVTAIASNFL